MTAPQQALQDEGICLDISALKAAVRNQADLLETIRTALAVADQRLAEQFWNGAPVAGLVKARATVVDQILVLAWDELLAGHAAAALVAVGGFGRGELHPHSDVDLMILLDAPEPDLALRESIEAYFALLWDAGLYLGHSVRTVPQCAEQAVADVVIATNLMESRLLAGNRALFEAMVSTNASSNIWPGPAFFEAKYNEQLDRHARFHDTAYNLEPNIKEGPGGLRDIQMISWVFRRHFGTPDLHGLVEHGFLTEFEYDELQVGQQFLWRVRFALHLLAGRAEDRLLFDYQREIATRLGFGPGLKSNAAVEQFMQQYYRQVMQLERLNESLLQLFREEFLPDEAAPSEHVSADFVVQNGFLGLRDERLFDSNPEMLVKMFVQLARDPEILGVRAAAIRAIRTSLQNPALELHRVHGVPEAFLDLLRRPEGVYTQLQRMNRYGVLAALLPPFASITGRMQFDLFHVYTVDQHILFVVRNLRRFAYGKYARQFPHMAEIFKRIDQPEILYLAAIFHDIAKGRDGDHSVLGAQEVREFCASLPLDEKQVDLVAWLVEQHLLMSQTAQRKDISDMDIIAGFADAMGSQQRLDHLYLLTVADIAATSPKLWNDWKSGLLWELFNAARAVLENGTDLEVDQAQQLASAKSRAARLLNENGVDPDQVSRLWQTLPPAVFMRISTGQLVWATTTLADLQSGDGVRVATRSRTDLGTTEILVSAPDYTGLFASTTAVIDEMGLNVLAARVFTSLDERSFDLFQVVDAHNRAMNRSDREQLAWRLEQVLKQRQLRTPVQRKTPRRLRPFVSTPRITFSTARGDTVTALELECTDLPGLLSRVSAAMVECGVRIHDAMIATFGDRVEDTFLITDRSDQLLDETARAQLVEVITKKLEPAGLSGGSE